MHSSAARLLWTAAAVAAGLTCSSRPTDPTGPDGGGLRVFLGAEGFGTATPAGRGGVVYRVTNLNDRGTGSLRAALEASGARVAVFEVSGTIVLTSNIRITSPFVTVAGQTAPSPGITIRGAAIQVNSHDVLIQHLRIRVGDDPSGPSPGNRDGLDLYGYTIVVDHVSVSWGIDENASTTTSGTRHDITILNSIISEGLNHSIDPSGYSKGLLVGDGTERVAVLRSLFAHNGDRNPYFKGGTSAVFANNVVYNWGGGKAVSLDDFDNSGLAQLEALVGNVFLPGVNTTATSPPIHVDNHVKPGSRFYVADNSNNGAAPPADPWTLVRNDIGASVKAGSPPLWVQPLTLLENGAVRAWVLAHAGARPGERDAVDLRIVNDVTAGTGQIIDSPSQVGGWPALAEHTRPLTLPADPNADDDGDGYTNLEEWLAQYAARVEGVAP